MEFPIIAEINLLRKFFPNISLEWVESHKKVADLAESLNTEADKVAALHHHCIGKWENRTNCLLLP